MLGQALGLPPAMGLYSFIGVAVTSATIVIYGRALWGSGRCAHTVWKSGGARHRDAGSLPGDPSHEHRRNVVSPANDFANIAPRFISFRTGGYITAVIGVMMMPWKLLADPSGYIFTWLIAYSALLGPIEEFSFATTSSSGGRTSMSHRSIGWTANIAMWADSVLPR